jgi:hypothetical protein
MGSHLARRRLMRTWRPLRHVLRCTGRSVDLWRSLMRRMVCLSCLRLWSIVRVLRRLMRIVAGSRGVLRSARLLVIRGSWNVLRSPLLRMIVLRRTRHIVRRVRLLSILRWTRHSLGVPSRVLSCRRPVCGRMVCLRCFASAESPGPRCRHHRRSSVVHRRKLGAIVAGRLFVLDLG